MNSSADTGATGYAYHQSEASELLGRVIRTNVAAEAWQWLEQKALQSSDAVAFNSAFAQMPRKTGRSTIRVDEEESARLASIVPGFFITGWPADRLCRAWLLLQLEASDKNEYTKRIEALFIAAEMNELVALYSALPLLAYPRHWKKRCAEGIRSNIGDVLQAIMCSNPYPSGYLEEAAWNQMVLKAFFTEKKVQHIVGLDRRANPELAAILLDYAHERRAAHRSVNPQLWRCIGKFIDEKSIADIERLFDSEDEAEREAAALACHDSSFVPAKLLLEKNKALKQSIEAGHLTWLALAQKTAASS